MKKEAAQKLIEILERLNEDKVTENGVGSEQDCRYSLYYLIRELSCRLGFPK